MLDPDGFAERRAERKALGRDTRTLDHDAADLGRPGTRDLRAAMRRRVA
jgi:hypothetical protein